MRWRVAECLLVLVAVYGSLQGPATAQTNGLVGAWAFNEGAGTTAGDSSGLGNTGTLNGATWTTGGRFGSALSFNGTNAWVTVPDAPALDLSTGMTLMAWINPTATTGVRDIIIKEGGGVDNYNLYHRNWAGRSEANVFVGGTNRTAEINAVPANTWTHVAGTYNGTTLRLFVNGAQVSSLNVSGSIPNSSGPLRFGGNSLWGEFFKGTIDEVRVYNRALTAAEIQADMNTPIPTAAPAPPPPPPSEIGEWSGPFAWPLVAVHAALLPTGRVLAWDASPAVPIHVWDPATTTHTQVPSPWTNIFCSGFVLMPDGRLLVVGGHVDAHNGLIDANVFDPIAGVWASVSPMHYPRWYPTATTLPDGRVLVTSGETNCLGCEVEIPEIYTPSADAWERLTSSGLYLPFYPHMFVLPDGRVLAASSAKQPMATYALDLGTRTWSTVSPTVLDGGSAVMYLPGKIMKSGTSATSDPPYIASASTTYTLDMLSPTPAWHAAPPMAFARAYHTLTLLPDGTVLAAGGGETTDVNDLGAAVLEAELWSPASGWKTLAAMQTPRLYHSIALLLPDARVLLAGGGRWGVDQFSAEIYSPPYLFKGPRPTITTAPATVAHNASFFVETLDASRITTVSLIPLGAVTHAFNQTQRYLPLTFQVTAGGLNVQAPVNTNLAPPGTYMLFLVDNAGVPSVASFVRLPGLTADLEQPTSPGTLTASGAVRSVSLSWTPATDNVAVTSYSIHRSTAPGIVPTGANRVGSTAATTYTDAGLAPGAYYYVVTARDAAANVGQPSPEATAQALADTVAPVVQITAPSTGATVSGAVTVTASVSDDIAVASLQFLLDDAPLGPVLTGPPFTTAWVTTDAQSGPHRLSARATDSSGNAAIAADVAVTLSNSASTGLVAAYAFSESNGNATADASGTGNHGTVSGASRTTSGRYGRGLSFDGNNDWVTIANSPSLNPSTAITMMAWVFPTVSSGIRDVVLKEGANVDVYNLYHRNWRGRPEANVFVGGVNWTAEGAPLPINAWTHLAGTYDGAVLRLFVNGVEVANIPVSGPLPPSTGPVRIGGNSLWKEFFKGRIDEVRIYNRALSPAEIGAAMNTPLP